MFVSNIIIKKDSDQTVFYFVKGKVEIIDANLVVIDAGGVGYAINTSTTSASSVKRGDQAIFYTYLHVREDIFELYGFASQSELNCFKQLISVSGVGPKAALAILSAITPERLREVAREIFRPENLVLTVKGNKRRIDRDRLAEITSGI